MEKFSGAGYEAQAPGWPGDAETVEATRRPADERRGGRHQRRRSPTTRASSRSSISRRCSSATRSAGSSRFSACSARGSDRRSRYRRRADQGNPGPAGLGAQGCLDRPQESVANRHKAVSVSRGGVSLRIRQRRLRAGVKELYDRWPDPSPGAPVRGRPRELLAEVARQGLRPPQLDRASRSRARVLTAGGQITPSRLRSRTRREALPALPGRPELREFPDRGHSLGIDGGWETRPTSRRSPRLGQQQLAGGGARPARGRPGQRD